MAVKRIWECDGCGKRAEDDERPADWRHVFVLEITQIPASYLDPGSGWRRDCCRDCAMRADPKNWQRKKSTEEILAELHRETLKQSVVRD